VRRCHIRRARDPAAFCFRCFRRRFAALRGCIRRQRSLASSADLQAPCHIAYHINHQSKLNALSARGRRICLVLEPTERKREALGDPHPCTCHTPDPTHTHGFDLKTVLVKLIAVFVFTPRLAAGFDAVQLPSGVTACRPRQQGKVFQRSPGAQRCGAARLKGMCKQDSRLSRRGSGQKVARGDDPDVLLGHSIATTPCTAKGPSIR
jgi:hypothetical protein